MTGQREVLVLNAGLFPDHETLAKALDSENFNNIGAMEVVPQEMDQAAWRKVLGRIMDADVTIVL